MKFWLEQDIDWDKRTLNMQTSKALWNKISSYKRNKTTYIQSLKITAITLMTKKENYKK